VALNRCLLTGATAIYSSVFFEYGKQH